MLARVTTFNVREGKLAQALQVGDREVVPQMSQQPGFRGHVSLSDAAANRAVSITFWASEAELQATEASGWYREMVGKFAPLVTGPPTREMYAVDAASLEP